MNKIPPTLLALAVLTLSAGFVTAQDSSKKKDSFVKSPAAKQTASGKADPFAAPANEPANEKKTTTYEIGILIEYFRLDHKTANSLVSAYASDAADARGLREELEKLIEADKATLEDTEWIRSKSGQRAKTESTSQRIYPVKFDSARLPKDEELAPKAQEKGAKNETPNENDAPNAKRDFSNLPVFPIEFETQNLGLTLEVDPVMGPDMKAVDLNLAPEFVAELEPSTHTKGTKNGDQITMPTFYTRKITTQLTAVPEKYNLLTIQKPHDDNGDRIIVLVRVDLIPVRE